MRPDGPRANDDQKKERDQPRNAVENAHGHRRVAPALFLRGRRRGGRVRVARDGGPQYPAGFDGVVHGVSGLRGVSHGVDGRVDEVVAVQAAAVPGNAVKQNRLGPLVHELVDLGSRVFAVTAEKGYRIRALQRLRVGRNLGRNQVPADPDGLRHVSGLLSGSTNQPNGVQVSRFCRSGSVPHAPSVGKRCT